MNCWFNPEGQGLYSSVVEVSSTGSLGWASGRQMAMTQLTHSYNWDWKQPMSLADTCEQRILALGLSEPSNGFVLGLVGC